MHQGMVTTALRAPLGLHAARRLRTMARAIARDGLTMLAASLIAPVVVVSIAMHRGPQQIIAVSLALLTADAVLSRIGRLRRSTAIPLVRLSLYLVYVLVAARLPGGAGTPPFAILALPVVAAASALGGRSGVLIGGAAIAAYAIPLAVGGDVAFAREREIVLVTCGMVLSVGTRRTVASLERVLARMRLAIRNERRKATQLMGVEAVGRYLAQAGATDDALRGVIDLLVKRFGFEHVSVYLGDPSLMRIGAHHGYAAPIPTFTPDTGVLGRVMRTAEPALVPDVSVDPDYVVGDDPAQSLISVPLVATGEIIGVINVETHAPACLDADDLATVVIVADRLASALALARERERLARRAASFEGLTALGQALTATLDPTRLYTMIADAIRTAIPSDSVTLTIREPGTKDFRIVATPGGDQRYIGAVITEGQGITGRAIAANAVVTDEALRRSKLPRTVRGADIPEEFSSIAAPLTAEGEAVGAIALVRSDPPAPFDDLEREVLGIVAAQASLAVANARLHSAAMEASLRDALTGLFNRRYLDTSMARLSAVRARQSVAERRPFAAILFDLDDFGLFNKRYGHGIGDDVLRHFGTVLRDSFRTSDLVARFGGEEFVVLLDGASRDEAVARADQVRERLAEAHFTTDDGEVLMVTVSAGCSGLEPEDESMSRLVTVADVALAMAKSAGRNLVVAA
ncbi:MAG: diguanylate cyclase [Chloroflexota bacterium]